MDFINDTNAIKKDQMKTHFKNIKKCLQKAKQSKKKVKWIDCFSKLKIYIYDESYEFIDNVENSVIVPVIETNINITFKCTLYFNAYLKCDMKMIDNVVLKLCEKISNL